MKKVFARIGVELIISDEEANQILKEAGSYFDGETVINNDLDINKEFARRFIEHGTLTCDSYIPENSIEEVDDETTSD